MNVRSVFMALAVAGGALVVAAELTPLAAQHRQMQPGPPAASMPRQPGMAGQRNFTQPQHASLSNEFRTALEPHGRWQHNSRWGDVWRPMNRRHGWRPYTMGRWAYTNDWGWYWVAEGDEADWGLVTYHYGRWVLDDDGGWFWIPGYEWGPAFVEWRRGGAYAGWAPLPPDEVVVEYRERPDYWIFVREPDLIAPRIADVILPFERETVFFNETVVVNRPVSIHEAGAAFAVNPGIAPAIVAAAVGRPLTTFDVQPRVLAGTAPIPGAQVVQAQALGSGQIHGAALVRQTQNLIQPARNVAAPQPLAGQQGRLGDSPPRAATRTAPQRQIPTTGQAIQPGQQPQPQQLQQHGQQQQQQQGRQAQPTTATGGQPKGQTTGQGAPKQGVQQGQVPPTQPQQIGKGKKEQLQGQRQPQQGVGTQGRGGVEQKQQQQTQQQKQLPPTERRGVQQRQPQPKEQHAIEPQHGRPELGTQGRSGGGAVQHQQPQAQQHAVEPQRGRQELGTQGRGGGAHEAAPPAATRGLSGGTVGHGGGGGPPAPAMHGPAGGGAPHGGSGGPQGGGAGGPPHGKPGH